MDEKTTATGTKMFESEWVVGQVLDSMRTMEQRLDRKMDQTHMELKSEVQAYRQEVISQGKVIATLAQRCHDQEDTCGSVHKRLDAVEEKVDAASVMWRRVAGFLAGFVAFLVGVAEAIRWWFEVRQR